ncbi:hypothetical protein JKY79_01685, partial [Candidatus Babeliales bacterium]|nr:hypothetical protein [Candidatus Babeliales bacterium]
SDKFDIIIIDGHADGLGSSLYNIADIIPNLKRLNCFQLNLTGSIRRGINPFNQYELLIKKIFYSPRSLNIELQFTSEIPYSKPKYIKFIISPKGLGLKKAL